MSNDGYGSWIEGVLDVLGLIIKNMINRVHESSPSIMVTRKPNDP
jgi:hypothetical protein